MPNEQTAATSGQPAERNDSVERFANGDPLTGLLNRYAIQDALSDAVGAAVSRGGRGAVLFVDLDRFKIVNDSMGHEAGDRLLAELAPRLSALLGEGDSVGRLGGDEFMLVLGSAPDDEAIERAAAAVLQAVNHPFASHGHAFHVAASIGVAVFPQDGTDPQTLVRNADLAMYEAKKAGGDISRRFEPEMTARVISRLRLEEDLRRAVDAREFAIAYQPMFDFATNEVTGMEALIRWHHPERGNVPPGDFIGVAEECGLIVQIGQIVVDKVCAQIRAWLDAGLDVPQVAINASPIELLRSPYVATIARALSTYGLAPSRLEVEITEGVLLRTNDKTVRVLKELRDLGVSISVDDFGTGYSSLAYLRHFPIDKLKIDRSFVARLEEGEQDRAIVDAIMAICRTLNLRSVAEGIETPAQLEHLRERGCGQSQGFLLAKPLAPDALVAYLKPSTFSEASICA